MMGEIPNLTAIRDWCKSMFQPIGNYAAQSDIPTQISQLTNNSGYITKSADDLENYFKKSETYNRSAADEKFAEKTEISVATVESAGKVRPDGTTITIDADGTIHAVSAQELAESVLGGES